jgi:hypothetical protein
MPSFTLLDIQPQALLLIQAAAQSQSSPLANVPVAVEGATDVELDAVVETAMRQEGIAVIVTLPTVARQVQSRPGVTVARCELGLLVVENRTQNRTPATGGLNRDPLAVVSALWTALVGQPITNGPYHFELAPVPLARVGEGLGTLIYAVEFEAPILVLAANN